MADYIYTMEIRLTPDQLKGVGLVQDVARAAGMKSIGVTRNGKPLPADLVTRSLAELTPNAFDNLLLSGVRGARDA